MVLAYRDIINRKAKGRVSLSYYSFDVKITILADKHGHFV